MRLGERQKLIVVKKVEFGIYLAERQDAGKRTESCFRLNRFRQEQKREIN